MIQYPSPEFENKIKRLKIATGLSVNIMGVKNTPEQDITDNVLQLSNIRKSKKLFPPYSVKGSTLKATVNNKDRTFTKTVGTSILYNKIYTEDRITVDFKLRSLPAETLRSYTGKIHSINLLSDKLAEINAYDEIDEILKKEIGDLNNPVTLTQQTPYQILKYMLGLIGFDIDNPAQFNQYSISLLRASTYDIFLTGTIKETKPIHKYIEEILITFLGSLWADESNILYITRYMPLFIDYDPKIYSDVENNKIDISLIEDPDDIVTKIDLTYDTGTKQIIWYANSNNPVDENGDPILDSQWWESNAINNYGERKTLKYNSNWIVNKIDAVRMVNLIAAIYSQLIQKLNMKTTIQNIVSQLDDKITVDDENKDLNSTDDIFTIYEVSKNLTNNIGVIKAIPIGVFKLDEGQYGMYWAPNDEGLGHDGDGQVPYNQADYDSNFQNCRRFGFYSGADTNQDGIPDNPSENLKYKYWIA